MKMNKCAIILASALCILSFLNSAYGKDSKESFHVKGTVYCDTCRARFINRLSRPLQGAKVRLECTDPVNIKNVTVNKEAVTDALGEYKVEVEGDHEDEACQVTLVASSDPDCSEVDYESPFLQQAAKITITGHNGIVSFDRSPNPLYFLRKQPLADCVNVLKELELNADGSPIDLDN